MGVKSEDRKCKRKLPLIKIVDETIVIDFAGGADLQTPLDDFLDLLQG